MHGDHGELDCYVEAFESARHEDGAVDVKAYVPPREHPQYAGIVVELLRVDVECSWRPGQASRLADYRRRFPEVFTSPAQLAPVAYEEYRVRRLNGDPVSREDYAAEFGVDTEQWPELPVGAGVATDEPPPSDSWLREMSRSAPRSANRLASALRQLPAVGEQFLEFDLVAELGRGALGRVYLARQGDLAHRLVALKVTPQLTDEPQRLAQLQHTNIVPIYSLHQRGPLQAVCMPFLGSSTLASVMRSFQGCPSLPLSGRALVSTLAAEASTMVDWRTPQDSQAGLTVEKSRVEVTPVALERLGRMSYLDAVVWLMARTAGGLAHAHEHGIVHCDLKPANILLSDDGEPVILDFHLATQRTGSLSSAAMVGGTLPYMAPEHLAALKSGSAVDHRCDLYSLGMILYELLTGRSPYPIYRGSFDDVMNRMLKDRREAAAPVQSVNPRLPAGLDSVVARCLQFDPDLRYQAAGDLQEDLQRHIEHRPLVHVPNRSMRERAVKWSRRHPRLSSASFVVAVAMAFLVIATGAWWWRGVQLRRQTAENLMRHFESSLVAVRAELNVPGADAETLNRGIRDAQRALRDYPVLDSAGWTRAPGYRHLAAVDRRRLQRHVTDMLYLLAAGKAQQAVRSENSRRNALLDEALDINQRAGEISGSGVTGPAMLLQRARILEAMGHERQAADSRRLAGRARDADARSRALHAWELAQQHDYYAAELIYDQLLQAQPRDWNGWFSLGSCQLARGHYREAEASYSTAIALAPHSYLGYFCRGLSRLDLQKYRGAVQDFDSVLAARADISGAWVNRALAREALGEPAEAIADLSQALQRGATQTRIYFVRARLRTRLGNEPGAEEDRSQGLALRPTDELSWIARGLARMNENPDAALEDLGEALRINPRSKIALQDMAHVLSERLGRTSQAVEVLDRLVELLPDEPGPVASRGVLLARLGRRERAVADAKTAAQLSTTPLESYQVGCIYALTSQSHATDATRAIDQIAAALKRDPSLVGLALRDPDLRPLEGRPDFRRLLGAARELSTFHPTGNTATAVTKESGQ